MVHGWINEGVIKVMGSAEYRITWTEPIRNIIEPLNTQATTFNQINQPTKCYKAKVFN